MNGISRQCIARVHAFIHVHEFWTIIPLKIMNNKKKNNNKLLYDIVRRLLKIMSIRNTNSAFKTNVKF